MRIRPIATSLMLWSTVLMFGGCGTPKPAAAQESSLGKILTDERLWGADAFAAFALLDQWRRVGAPSIIVLPDRIVSGAPSATAAEAEETAAAMAPAKKRVRSDLQGVFAQQYSDAIETERPKLRAEAATFLEDNSNRVVWTAADGEFLQKGLTIQTVVDAYGKPEMVTSETIHFEGDRRPESVTKYGFAEGAIQFIESNFAPTPGLVDRVVIAIEPAVKELYGP